MNVGREWEIKGVGLSIMKNVWKIHTETCDLATHVKENT